MNGRGRLNRSADEDERRTADFEAKMTVEYTWNEVETFQTTTF